MRLHIKVRLECFNTETSPVFYIVCSKIKKYCLHQIPRHITFLLKINRKKITKDQIPLLAKPTCSHTEVSMPQTLRTTPFSQLPSNTLLGVHQCFAKHCMYTEETFKLRLH